MCFEMQPAIVPLRPKDTSAVLVVKCVRKWFAGLRPVLETLQQGCAIYCNMEIPSGKATAFQEYLLRGSSCSRERMRSCLVLTVSCKPAVSS